jgi:predicted  nucleic acid-binding Zn-ribbon protein
MMLECDRCGKRWDYGGNRKVRATCPDCGKQVKIRKG